MNSALYSGWVQHRRLTGKGHSFRYRVFMPFLDLDELPDLLASAPGWSATGPALATFRREDFLGDPEIPPVDTAFDGPPLGRHQTRQAAQ